MAGEAIVVPLTAQDSGGDVATALAAGAASAEAGAALDVAEQAQGEATAALSESAALSGRVDVIGGDVLALSQRISHVEGMLGELTGTLIDAINAVEADDAEPEAPDIMPVTDEAPAEAEAEEAAETEGAAPPVEDEAPKEEKRHHAAPRRKYGFRH